MINTKQQNNVYILGAKSKFAKFIFNRPWLALLLLYLFTIGIAAFSPIPVIVIVKWMSVSYIPSFILFRLGFRNQCYKAVIDNNRQIMQFYIAFSKDIVEVKTNEVKVLVRRGFKCIVPGKKISMWSADYNFFISVVNTLPESTEVRFEGISGKIWEKSLIRRNKLPIPGSRFKKNLGHGL